MGKRYYHYANKMYSSVKLNFIQEIKQSKIERRAVMRYLVVALIIFGSSIYSAEAFGEFSCEAQYWNFDESFDHDTHPDDKAFLVGRAGETELQNGYGLAFKYEFIIADNEDGIYISINGGALFIGAEEKRKNDNDPRPTGSHSEIYSRIAPGIGPIIGANFGWKFRGKFYIGLSADATFLNVEHGWNRYGSYDSVEQEWKTFVTAGPEVKYYFTENSSVFAGYNFGNANYGKIGIMFDF